MTTLTVLHPAEERPVGAQVFTPAGRDASRASFLLATWDGGGHAGPALSVARALFARGHDVRVLADPVLRAEVEASGATFVPYRRAPHTRADGTSSAPRDPRREPAPHRAAAHVRDALICGPAAAFAADCREELRRRHADVVAADHMLPGVLIGAEAEGSRTASLATSFLMVPEWGVPAMGFGLRPGGGPARRLAVAALRRAADRMWRGGLPALNEARRRNGLDPVERPVDVIAGPDRVLGLVSSALEFPQFRPPGHVRLVGARTDDPAWAAPWAPPPGDAPLVLAALSSSFMDQAPALRRLAEALGRLDVRGVLTTGPAIDPDEIDAPRNVQVVRSAPHAAVLREADLLITHAGHGTVAKAMAAGVPTVCLPFGRDQHDVAARVVAAGAGMRIPRRSAPMRIARAVERVLGDPRYGVAARRVATAMAEEARGDRAVAELEALALRTRLGASPPAPPGRIAAA